MKPLRSACLTFLAITALASLTAGATAPANRPTDAAIDRVVARTMSAFSVPGIAVGIIKDGKLVFSKGYGVRALDKPDKVDIDTLFAIGSNTKAFTTAALSMLVDEGKIHWDDKVIDYLPDFRMFDPFVTREFTIRDLLTHRSGLGLGAGDLLFVTPTDFTRHDVLRALRYLKPVTSFRSEFAYDNLMYVVAGEVIAAASGQSWEDFVEARILKPLHMDACATESARLKSTADVAAPHVLVEGKLTRIAPLEVPIVGPAGGIQCNITGMAKWVVTQLAHGKAPDGATLWSGDQSQEMWSAQTILPARGKVAALTQTHLASYGLGWGLQDYMGYLSVSHDGGLPGMVTHVGLLPELNVGVLVLTNQQDGYALGAIALQILDAYVGAPQRDWVDITIAANAARKEQMKESNAARKPSTVAGPAPANLDAYVGTFTDAWRGDATITRHGDGLELSISHTKALTGPLTWVGNGIFVARWLDRTLDADAYVRFTPDYDGRIGGFTMQAESASTDFSYDFQDLDFKRAAAPIH